MVKKEFASKILMQIIFSIVIQNAKSTFGGPSGILSLINLTPQKGLTLIYSQRKSMMHGTLQ